MTSPKDRQRARRKRLAKSGGKQVSVALSPESVQSLKRIRKVTGENSTQVINRGIGLAEEDYP